jgi:hypothetical protein
MNRPESTAEAIDVRFPASLRDLRSLAPDVPATAWLANVRQPFRLKAAAKKSFQQSNLEVCGPEKQFGGTKIFKNCLVKFFTMGQFLSRSGQ